MLAITGCSKDSGVNTMATLLSQGRSQLANIQYWAYQIQEVDSPGMVDSLVNSLYERLRQKA